MGNGNSNPHSKNYRLIDLALDFSLFIAALDADFDEVDVEIYIIIFSLG